MSDLDNGTLLLSVKTFTERPPAIRHIHVKTAQNKELQRLTKLCENFKSTETRATTAVAPYIDRMKTPETHTSDTQHPSSGRKMKSDSDIVAGRENNKKFIITVRSKGNHTPETIKKLIKQK